MQHLDLFKSFEQVAGIMLDGGMSRGYADELSEIDVVVFVHEQAFEAYSKKKTPCALGITMIDGQLYDVKMLNYEKELAKEYEGVALWDLSYAEILYDPQEELQKLFDKQLKTKVEAEMAGGMMFHVWWTYRLAGDIWIKREDALQGHYCLNDAIKPLISALFIANGEYLPHDKWLIHMSRTLSWKPDNYDELLSKILDTGDMSMESLVSRQKSIELLWQRIDAKLCEQVSFQTGLNLMHKGVYENLQRIVKKGIFTVEEWNTFSCISDLNQEPLYGISRIEDGKVLIEREKMYSLGEKDLYSWFLTVVQHIAKQK